MFVEPFAIMVWIVLAVLWMFICLVSYIVVTVQYTKNQVHSVDQDIAKSSIFWCIALCSQQGMYITIRGSFSVMDIPIQGIS